MALSAQSSARWSSSSSSSSSVMLLSLWTRRKFLFWWLSGGLLLLLRQSSAATTPVPPLVRYECDPCIERRNSVVRLIVHGSQDDVFWQQVSEAIWQIADSLRITLQFELYERVDFVQMAADIRRVGALVSARQHPNDDKLANSNNGESALRNGNSNNNNNGRDSDVPDVLIVSLPSQEVEEAVAEVVATGLPVFGMNSGYNRAADLGLQAFVGMDEYQAGVEAGREFLRVAEARNIPLDKILFINHAKGNFALEQRRRGLDDFLRQALLEQSRFATTTTTTTATTTTATVPFDDDPLASVFLDNNSNSNSTTAATTAVTTEPTMPGFSTIRFTKHVWEVALSGGPMDPLAMERLAAFLEADGGCPYQGLMASSTTLAVGLEALQLHCPEMDIVVGSFDTNTFLYQAIAVGDLDFCISQQQWLQASMATVMASLFASTGMRLQLSSETEFGTYLSGPQVITIRNLPTDTLQICETEGYPICRPLTSRQGDTASAVEILENGLTEAGCLCFDSQNLQLAAVLHGVDTDPFWWVIRDAALQAALDTQINFEVELFPAGDDTETLNSKLASKIISLCQQGIDGLIVSIPSSTVVAALRECQMLNIPIVAINAGGAIAEQENLLHYVGQDEVVASEMVGQQFLNAGARRGICLNHAPDLPFVVDRCRRFGQVIEDQFGPDAYLGMVSVEQDNADITLSRAERAVEVATGVRGGDWKNLAILVPGSVLLEPLVELLERHPEALGGTYDSDPQIITAVSDGKIKFGIDQQTYLQGYVPVVLLTWFAQTRQALTNQYIASGPSFVVKAPSSAEQQCREKNFAICPPPLDVNLNQLGAVRIIGFVLGGTAVFTAWFFALYVAKYRKSPNISRSQPFFLLMVCAGSALMGTTIFVLAVDDKNASDTACDIACMAAPWLFTIGFTVAFAALYSKLVRLNKLINKAVHFRRIEVKPKDVMTPFFVLLSLNVAFLTTWSLADSMYWKRSYISEVESYGICRLGTTWISVAMALGIVFVNVVALLLALHQAFKTRKVSYEFSESGSIAIVVASILQVAIVGVPILPLVRDDPAASFLLKSGLVFVVSMSTSLFIFVPKMRKKSTSVALTVRNVVAANANSLSMASGAERTGGAFRGGGNIPNQQTPSQYSINSSSSATRPYGGRSSFSVNSVASASHPADNVHLNAITEDDGESVMTHDEEEFGTHSHYNTRHQDDAQNKGEKFENEHAVNKPVTIPKEGHPMDNNSRVPPATDAQRTNNASARLDSVTLLKQLGESIVAGEITRLDILKMIDGDNNVESPTTKEEKSPLLIESDKQDSKATPTNSEDVNEGSTNATVPSSNEKEESDPKVLAEELAKQLAVLIEKTTLGGEEIEKTLGKHGIHFSNSKAG